MSSVIRGSRRQESPRIARAEVAMPTLPLTVRLVISSNGSTRPQPLTVGIPFPKGSLRDTDSLVLLDDQGSVIPLQTEALAHWSDGSLKWVLLDFVADHLPAGRVEWLLRQHSEGERVAVRTAGIVVQEAASCFRIKTGKAELEIDRSVLRPVFRASNQNSNTVAPQSSVVSLTDAEGRVASGRVLKSAVETSGPVRSTIRLEGEFKGHVPAGFIARVSCFAGTGLVRLQLTVHNPQPARHRGGLWDLGDKGAMYFRDLSLEFNLPAVTGTVWQAEPDAPQRTIGTARLEIYQDSSGGENWQSPNHVNRDGKVPLSFRGYRVRTAAGEEHGLRASPRVCVEGPDGFVAAAVPEFWEQFPKAFDVQDRTLSIRLFPGQFGDLFELQGGEQKTHTVWLAFGTGADGLSTLEWVHEPTVVLADPEWYASTGAIPHLTPGNNEERISDTLVSKVITGPKSFFAGRETIDEYGWRNFGDVFADHEEEYYKGPPPFISHYNNQYDIVFGTILQYLRSGEPRWMDLAAPLARHVSDIDIYHTDRDRAAYNGGSFWFTYHYETAATGSHRGHTRNDVPRIKGYGGGPSGSHLFTTGLLHYYYLTGDHIARDAVISLADWVVNMDDGRRNVLGIIDPGPTGTASNTRLSHYHGPGRGCGNPVNALLDGWLLTGNDLYSKKAEELIRRAVHPLDDVPARDLLNAELWWSYTVFLVSLARYLLLKAEAGQLDRAYAYGRAALLRYATWMVEHERPVLDHPELLEFVTSAWPGQELRKASVLRMAAEHADEPLRSQLLRRGEEFADRAWNDLVKFDTHTFARTQALAMAEKHRDDCFRGQPAGRLPAAQGDFDFGVPHPFLSQRQRVKGLLKSPRYWGRALLGVFDLRRWWALTQLPWRSLRP